MSKSDTLLELNDDLAAAITKLRKSRSWGKIETFLVNLRETLLSQPARSRREMWVREGKLELTMLLLKAPMFMGKLMAEEQASHEAKTVGGGEKLPTAEVSPVPFLTPLADTQGEE